MPEELVISFDAAALAALKSRSSSGGKHWSESVLRIAQIVSFVGAAFWTVYVWFAFDERKNDLALKLASVQYMQSQLSIEETRLNIQTKRVAGEQLAEVPVTISTKLESHRTGRRRGGVNTYLASFEYRITNVGAHTITIDDILLHAFAGTLRRGAQTPAFMNSFRETGPIQWTPVKPTQAYIFSGWLPGMTLGSSYETVVAKNGGGGTGRANPGETLVGSAEIVIDGRPDDLVGFSVLLHAQAPGTHRSGKVIETIDRLGQVP